MGLDQIHKTTELYNTGLKYIRPSLHRQYSWIDQFVVGFGLFIRFVGSKKNIDYFQTYPLRNDFRTVLGSIKTSAFTAAWLTPTCFLFYSSLTFFPIQEVPADQQDQPAEAEQCPLQFRKHHARLHSTYLSPDTPDRVPLHVTERCGVRCSPS